MQPSAAGSDSPCAPSCDPEDRAKKNHAGRVGPASQPKRVVALTLQPATTVSYSPNTKGLLLTYCTFDRSSCRASSWSVGETPTPHTYSSPEACFGGAGNGTSQRPREFGDLWEDLELKYSRIPH